MIVIDGHVHMAQEVFRWNRDVTSSLEAIRQSEAGMTDRGRGRGTIALPEMRKGKVAQAEMARYKLLAGQGVLLERAHG